MLSIRNPPTGEQHLPSWLVIQSPLVIKTNFCTHQMDWISILRPALPRLTSIGAVHKELWCYVEVKEDFKKGTIYQGGEIN